METWQLSHESFSRWESFTLGDKLPYVLVYSNGDGIEKSCALNDADHKKLISTLERSPLADTSADRNENTFRYILDIDMKDDDAGYFAAVEGEEAFSFMESCFE